MTVNRVVITGMGAIASIGSSPEEIYTHALEQRSGVVSIESFANAQLNAQAVAKTQLAAGVVAPVQFDIAAQFSRSELSLLDRVAQLGMYAARQAVAQSGLNATPQLLDEACVYWGASMGGANTLETGYIDLFLEGKGRVRPFSIMTTMNNSTAAQIALQYGMHGSVLTYSSACASSAQAIGEAYRAIRLGVTERAVVGGSEAMLTTGVLKSWEALRTLAIADPADCSRSCKPFSANRSGLVVGEAGAALVLESLASAQARGAVILAELAGYGSSNDATHMTKPDMAGQVRAIHQALSSAGLNASDIGYINAHGTATAAGDQVESAAIRAAFGAHAEQLAVSSTKAVHGHTLGAAGALEAVITVQALRERQLPPTAHLDQADPDCNLDYLPTGPRVVPQLRAALSSSFAFGGANAVLAFKEF